MIGFVTILHMEYPENPQKSRECMPKNSRVGQLKSIVMKKLSIFLVLAVLVLPALSDAQTDKGKVMMGLSSRYGLNTLVSSNSTDLLSVGFSKVTSSYTSDEYSYTDETKVSSFNIQPRFGYFVADNFAIGLDLNYSLLSLKDTKEDSKMSEHVVGAGPFIRYYFPTEKVMPYIELNSLFGSTKSKYELEMLGDDESKENFSSIGGGLGVAIPIGNRVSFDTLLGYNSYKTKVKDESSYESSDTYGTFGLKMGFTVYLGKNKQTN